MKNNLLTVLKVTTINNFGMNKLFSKTGKKGLGVVLTFFVMLFVLCYAALYAFIGFSALKQYNLQEYLPMIFALIAMVFGFMLSIYRAKSMLFDSKDNDLLFSLPIKSSTILTSRILNLLSINYISTIAVFLPCIVVYGILAQMGIVYYVLSLIVLLFLPAIPTVLASILGYVIAYITSKLGSKKILEIIITFAMFFVVYLGITSFSEIGMKLVQNIDSLNVLLNRYLLLLVWMKDAMIHTNFASMLLYIGANVAIFATFIGILSIGYRKLLLSLNTVKIKRKHGKLTYQRNNMTISLVKKEFKKYLATPVYVFNTAFGVVILAVLTVTATFMGKEGVIGLLNTNGILSTPNFELFTLLIMMIAFIVSMSNTAASSISLEGQNIWILKSLPIETKRILLSKVILNIVVVLPITIICSVILGGIIGLTLLEYVVIILFAILLNLAISYFGLLVNLIFPKLKFVSEVQVVKQSMSNFIAILVPLMIIMLGAVGFFFLISQFGNINAMLIICGIIAMILAIEIVLTNTWGVKRFQQLE